MKQTLLLLIGVIIVQFAYSVFIYAPIIVHGGSYVKYPYYPPGIIGIPIAPPDDPPPTTDDTPVDDLPVTPAPEPEPLPEEPVGAQEIVLYQKSDCSTSGSRYVIPITGACQEIPSWLHDDSWKIGAVVSSKRISVRFYTDTECAEVVPETPVPYSRSSSSSSSSSSDCVDLDGLSLNVRSFRLITF